MNEFFVALATLLYLSASVLIFRQVSDSKKMSVTAYVLTSIALICHLWVLYSDISTSVGQDMSMTNVLALIAWLTTFSMLVSASWMPHTLLMPGVVAFSGAAVLATGIIPEHHLIKVTVSSGIVTHITLSLLAYSCLSIAFLYALQMTYIRSRLKQKNKHLIGYSLPPLLLVESLLFRVITFGSVLLAISLVSGLVFIENMLSSQYAHKTVFSALALCVYILLLAGQKKWGWRNKQVVVLTSVGLVLLTLSYFGSRFVREILL
jgi:ABC-type uncharacterized transport system permease subunit